MSRIRCGEMLKHARDNSYAIGYFEAWDLASLCAIVRAAEIARAPVMTGFCGEYLANPRRKMRQSLELHAMLARKAADDASVPVSILLNECADMHVAYQGVKNGFDMVMFVDEAMPENELTPKISQLVEFAHACGVAVEAEVGALGMAEQSTGQCRQGRLTKPEIAVRFVQETGVDALAVSVGNIHFLENGKATIDLELLEQLHRQISAPLALHGGTGVDKADFQPAIQCGIAKVNVGAGLKRAVLDNEKRYFAEHNVDLMNPNDVLGKGGKLDLSESNQTALIQEILGFISAFGGQNRAS